MPFQAATDCVSITINGTYFGKPIANVLNAHCRVPYDQTELDNIAANVDGVVGSYYLPHLSNAVEYVNTHVRGLTSPIDLESINAISAGNGADSSGDLPANSTLCASLRTGATGRSARGRFYTMPTGINNMTDAQHYSASFSAVISTFFVNLIAVLNTQGADLVVLSRYTGGALRPFATYRIVNNVIFVDLEADSQRRRLLGR